MFPHHVHELYDIQCIKFLNEVNTYNIIFFLCVLGLMALNGYVISGEVYAWAAVLILPINSALNPFLYTLSAVLNKRVRIHIYLAL